MSIYKDTFKIGGNKAAENKRKNKNMLTTLQFPSIHSTKNSNNKMFKFLNKANKEKEETSNKDSLLLTNYRMSLKPSTNESNCPSNRKK